MSPGFGEDEEDEEAEPAQYAHQGLSLSPDFAAVGGPVPAPQHFQRALPPGMAGQPGQPAQGPIPAAKVAAASDPFEQILAGAASAFAAGHLSAKDVFFLKAMSAFGERNKKSKPSNVPADEGDSSDDEDVSRTKHLKAFDDLESIRRAIEKNPSALIAEFEEEARRIIGVTEGMPWTLQDMRSKLYWGRNSTLNRAASLDLESYMILAKDPRPSLHVRKAKAQLIQSFRAKYQASLDGGSWAQAWLLTGVEDPCSRRKWAAPQWQVSATANYLRATSELQKQVNANVAAGSQQAPWQAPKHVEESPNQEGEPEDGEVKPKAKRRGRGGRSG
jgi:hypothetical protein